MKLTPVFIDQRAALEKYLKSAEESLNSIIPAITDSTYTSNEGSLHLPFDESILQEVELCLAPFYPQEVTDVVLIGIGGSNLGAVAVYEAVGSNKRLHTLDTVSAKKLHKTIEVLKKIPAKQILIFAISKSGTTTETVANLETLLAGLAETHGDMRSRLITITDKDSALWKASEDSNIAHLEIPKMVGGRYSVFSSVGLAPLVALDIDVTSLLSGAKSALFSAAKDSSLHPATVSAGFTFAHLQISYTTHNSFFFHPELESVGKWYRQLTGESLGKELNLKGEVVHSGIVPIVSIGSTDLHSMAQLYFGGPKEIMHQVVSTKTHKFSATVPTKPLLSNLNKMIEDQDLNTILEAIVQGTLTACHKTERPCLHIELAEINEYTIGEYLATRMLETMMLARLMNVNAFDQPNVEAYKTETKRLLGV